MWEEAVGPATAIGSIGYYITDQDGSEGGYSVSIAAELLDGDGNLVRTVRVSTEVWEGLNPSEMQGITRMCARYREAAATELLGA